MCKMHSPRPIELWEILAETLTNDWGHVNLPVEPRLEGVTSFLTWLSRVPEVCRQFVGIKRKLSTPHCRDEHASLTSERVAQLHRAIWPYFCQICDDKSCPVQPFKYLDINESRLSLTASHLIGRKAVLCHHRVHNFTEETFHRFKLIHISREQANVKRIWRSKSQITAAVACATSLGSLPTPTRRPDKRPVELPAPSRKSKKEEVSLSARLCKNEEPLFPSPTDEPISHFTGTTLFPSSR